MKTKILTVAISPVAESLEQFKKRGGLSGGDRILIELLRHWQDNFDTTVFTWNGGRYLIRDVHKVDSVQFDSLSLAITEKLGFFIQYISKILYGSLKALLGTFEYPDYIYSSSDFFPDFIPSLILHFRFPKAKWIGSLFLFSPNPFRKESPYRGKARINGTIFWLSQIPVKHLIKRICDMVFVTSEPDVDFFITQKRPREKILVIRGGVDIHGPQRVKKQNIEFDAVFIGRFHHQKGVLELIEIWNEIVKNKKEAKLAIIGLGELENKMRVLVDKFGLGHLITFFGFKDGKEKYRIFKKSKIVLHPAVYDSGGMAACEAFACGLPGVSFDLEALKTYYPQGMIKTECFDKKKFADNILKLLSDKKLYEVLSQKAVELARNKWNWEVRVREITRNMITYT